MSITVSIIDGPVPPSDTASAADTGAGAILTFDGVVRPLENHDHIAGLEYTAYLPMAEIQLQSLAREMLERHGLLSLAITHSRGVVPVGRVSMRVIIHSRHRAEALAAMGEFIDRLKREVPIWKRPIANL